jgi:DNA-directed RNA polymerase beta' subunit
VTTENITVCKILLRDGKVRAYQPEGLFGKLDLYNIREDKASPYTIHIIESLKPGDIIHRELTDGDPIVLMRQPVIHIHSIMGYRVLVVPGGDKHVIYMNPIYTPPHAADFDGDEASIFVPQTREAIAEIITRMNVTKCQISPYDQGSVYGLTYDSLISLSLLLNDGIIRWNTLVDVFNSLRTKYHLTLIPRLISEGVITLEDLAVTEEDDLSNIFLLRRLKSLHGRVLFSIVLPEGLDYTKGNVVISNGILVRGNLTKTHVGYKSSSSLNIAMFSAFGDEVLSAFFDDVTSLLTIYLEGRGYTISLKDCFPSGGPREVKKMKAEVNEEFDKVIKKFYGLATSLGETYEEILKDPLRKALLTKSSPNILNIIPKMKRITEKYFNKENAIVASIYSGAKGNVFNLANISVTLGQIFVGGEPPFLHSRLPYVHEDVLDPSLYGLCPSSYLDGLKYVDTAYSDQSTRRQLGILYLLTRDVGTARRNASKVSLNVMTRGYGWVVNEKRRIVQFAYGGDLCKPATLKSYNVGERNCTSPFDVTSISKIINLKHSR